MSRSIIIGGLNIDGSINYQVMYEYLKEENLKLRKKIEFLQIQLDNAEYDSGQGRFDYE